jgi:hypothetical protein
MIDEIKANIQNYYDGHTRGVLVVGGIVFGFIVVAVVVNLARL